ncbi:serine/threonine-protein kinase [Ornithinimicrobium sp. Y1847]|uniref:serine/threonine-protein kinase n=1 Tax=unclassified Ornithinimicrobium TaxID=2615080 RepID=UPI003B685C0D
MHPQDPHEPDTTAAAPSLDDPGLVAGRYRIRRTLGRGGGGIVWLAEDEHLGREVALKKVSGEADTDVLLTRGMREARISATLASEHVVRVYDAFEHEGAPWIVMEYVPGPSLADLIQDGSHLPVRTVASIGAQVAAALAAAHGAGVLHRDVKPANVLLTDDSASDAKLTDFGIARGDEDHQLTRTGMVSGTAAYFSPEIAAGEDPSPASDVWALGATLYAAVEGRRPFPDAANAVAQLHTIVREDPIEPERAGPLKPVLAGMLNGDPQQRWTAERAARELRRVADAPEGSAGTTRGAAGAAAVGAGSGSGPEEVWGAGATRQHAPVTSTRQVPVTQAAGGYARTQSPSGPPPREAAPRTQSPRAQAPRSAPRPVARRRAPSSRTVLTWLIAIPLLVLLGWLAWTIIDQTGGLGGDGSSQTSPVASTGEVDAAEANQLVRSFYLALVGDGGLEEARTMLGPDAQVDPEIADGLTRIAYDNSVTTAGPDGTQQIEIDVDYTYGDTVLEQRETLLVGRNEAGDPVILERSTTDR